MAIDSPDKRRSAAMSRRLPWMRRFIPGPDGTIAMADKAQLTGKYRGELADVDNPGSLTASVLSLFPPYAPFTY